MGRTALVAADPGDTMTKAPQASDCSKPPERRRSECAASEDRGPRRRESLASRDFCGFVESGASARSSEYLAAAASKALPS